MSDTAAAAAAGGSNNYGGKKIVASQLKQENRNRKRIRDDDGVDVDVDVDSDSSSFETSSAIGRGSKTNGNQIPSSVLINNVLPFLDHDTWKSFSIVSKDIYENTQMEYPPWPTDRMIVTKGEISKMTIAGNRVAVLERKEYSPFISSLVVIYDRRRGFIKRFDFGPLFDSETDYITSIRLLDSNALVVTTGRREGTNKDGSMFLSRIDDEDGIVPFSRKITYTNFFDGPLIFKWKGKNYLATVSGPTSDRPERIHINQYLGAHNWPNCLKETHCLEYPVLRDMDIENIELDYGVDDRGRLILTSVTTKEDRSRHVHCWCLDELPIRSSDVVPNVTAISYGTIPFFYTDDNMYNGPYDGPYYACSRFKIVIFPYDGTCKLRIIETFPDWWDDYDDEHDVLYQRLQDGDTNDEEVMFMELMEKYAASNVLVWENNNTMDGFELKNDFSITEQPGNIRVPVRFYNNTVSRNGRHLMLRSKTDGILVYQLDNINDQPVLQHLNCHNLFTRMEFSDDGKLATTWNGNKMRINYLYDSPISNTY